MSSTSVRISRNTHDALKDLATREHRSLGDILDDAIAQYRERLFWQEAREAYTRLRNDSDAWQDYKAEIAEWDATLMDGLDAAEVFEEEQDSAS